MSATSQRVHRFVTKDLHFRIASVVATEVVEEMRSIQNSLPVATTGVGRAMVGALLMASHLKDGQEVGMYLRGNGPLESIFAEATFEGAVRGYTPNSQLNLQPAGEQIRVGPAIGIGLLTVVRSSPMSKTPHRGTVELISGEVGDDIAYYLHQSHQIPSVVSLGVRLDIYGRVVAAGGVLIEALPGTPDSVLTELEASVRKVPSISDLIHSGATAKVLAETYLGKFEIEELEHPYPIRYQCRCSLDRVLQVVACLQPNEIDVMIEQDHGADMTCEFCGKRYRLEEKDLKEVRQKVARTSLH